MKLLSLVILLLPALAPAEDALIATAANFRTTLNSLVAEFEARTTYRLTVVSGSTGQLYAQILNGAPFDVFLSADQARPGLLEGGQYAVAGSRSTYAVGRLAVVGYEHASILEDTGQTLLQAGMGKLAIANPAVAPYGVASQQVLGSLELDDGHFSAIVLGENVSQAMTMVRTGNAALGLVALSLAMVLSSTDALPYVIVPAELHDPVRQDVVLLSHGKDNAAALAFLIFLRSPDGQAIIEAAGYEVE